MSEPLLIVGASARAAAGSALRAGFAPLAADKFGDADLLACCPARRVDDYPRGLPAAVADWPPCPWLYTGALENQSALVDKLRSQRPLYGNPGAVLRAVRDPAQVAGALRDAGLPWLEWAAGAERHATIRWLRKPLASCGGARIELVDGAAPERQGRPGCYYQRYQPGISGSSVYVADGRRAAVLGSTRQLIGAEWTGAQGFQYAGSIGPLELSESQPATIRQIGDCLAERFGLRGLFGVDWVLADGQVWPVEVNPRYTASVEVLEQALELRAIESHVRACRDGTLAAVGPQKPHGYCGKAILYAHADTTIPDGLTERTRAAAGPGVTLADVPVAGSLIVAAQPVLTVIVSGSSCSAVGLRLREYIRLIRDLLWRR